MKPYWITYQKRYINLSRDCNIIAEESDRKNDIIQDEFLKKIPENNPISQFNKNI